MKSIRVFAFSGGEEIGTIGLEEGKMKYHIKDRAMEDKIRTIAEKPLSYLKDEEIEHGTKTIRATASPGTEEHLRVLLFELRKIGLEGRINN